MTEKPEIAEAGVEAVSGIDPAAIGLALAAASRERADTFLAEQTRAAGPSLPFAHAEWGQALLERGEPKAAITKFPIARQKGPHFADPWSIGAKR